MNRRNYPKDLDGGKNEWKALIKHYEEFDMKANMLEQYAKNVVQSNQMRELTDQKLEHEQRKKQQRDRYTTITAESWIMNVKCCSNK